MAAYNHEDTCKSAAKAHGTDCSRRVSSTPRRNVRNRDSGSQIVAMMQTAEPWHRYYPVTHNAGVTHCLTIRGRFLRQRKMSSILVIIPDVLVHQAFQMPFVENDHMIDQIATTIPDPALGDTVLPRAPETGSLWLDAKALHRVDHFFIKLRAAIEDQIARRRVVGKCLAQLLNNPSTARMLCNIAVEDSSPIMRNDKKAVENAEGQRRYGEEVHCGNSLAMIAQERRPAFCRLGIARRFSHPAQHGPLRNIEAKHLQLSVNARRAPGSVLGDHAEDEFAQFPAHALSSHTVSIPRKPRPVELESRPMPANDGFRLDENQRPLPSRPKSPQYHPEHFVGSGKSRLRMPLFQDGELLTKGQVLQEEAAARIARLNDQIEQELQRTEHKPVLTEASRISMQTAFGSCPLHGLRYPTEKARVPVSPHGLSAEGRLCRQVWRGSLDRVERLR